MWRFRSNWRGKLILQRGFRVPVHSGLLGDHYISWRDATTEDLGSYYTGGMNGTDNQ
ncbi:MAG: hypothetical protein ACOYBW_08830 [Fluviibacter phosphoraccumulans]